MFENKEKKSNHLRQVKEEDDADLSASSMKRLKLLMCMDYIVNHIRNYDGYDFRHAWNLLGLQTDLRHVVDTVDEKELVRCKMDVVDDDRLFEDMFRIGVQALVHAVYPREWESIGCYLHPQSEIFCYE